MVNQPLNHYQLFRKLVQFYPLKFQQPWDKSKFLCPKKNWTDQTKRIFLMLDCEYDWFMGEKLGKGDFLIIHHPLIFDPTPKQQQILDLCRQKGIALLFFHTNFDFHPLGMNTSLLPLFAPTTVITNNWGCYFVNQTPLSLLTVINKVQNYLHPPQIIYDPKFQYQKLQKFHILLGSGGNFISEVVNHQLVDCYITGDMKWHNWHTAREANLTVIDVHHSSEQIFNQIINNLLLNKLQLTIPVIMVASSVKLHYQSCL